MTRADPATPAPIRPLAPADLDAVLGLVAESGWNQVAADWRIFMDCGAAFVATDAGRAIASAATLPFQRFGWISMVLVAGSHRRQGIATRLLEHCVEQLRGKGFIPALDATPAGRSVYQPLGFRDGWAITRWRRNGPPVASDPARSDATVRPMRESDWPQVEALDAPAFGAPRRELLRNLFGRSAGFACVAERQGCVTGFLLGRDGRLASQIGPVVAADHETAWALLADALQRIPGPVLLDALDLHEELRARLPAAGFAVERGYIRMALDAHPAFGDPATLFAIAGPELG
jgi:GNAT superfamily N-acetyltransferase